MNKKQLAQIELNRAKRLKREAVEEKVRIEKKEWKDNFHSQPLTDKSMSILKTEVDDVKLDHAIERYKYSRGDYVPRNLTIKLFQLGLLSTGLAQFGLNCTSAYRGMSRFSAYWHRDLTNQVSKYLKNVYCKT